MTSETQKRIESAEGELPEAPRPAERKQSSKKRWLTYVLFALCGIAAARVFLLTTAVVEPVYQPVPPDSASVIAGAEIIEEHVRNTGSLPEGLQERINSNPNVTLLINDDGSFTYTEQGIAYRSAPEILSLTGGEL